MEMLSSIAIIACVSDSAAEPIEARMRELLEVHTWSELSTTAAAASLCFNTQQALQASYYLGAMAMLRGPYKTYFSDPDPEALKPKRD